MADRTANQIIDNGFHELKIPFYDFKPCITGHVNSFFQANRNNSFFQANRNNFSANGLHEINEPFLPSITLYSDIRR